MIGTMCRKSALAGAFVVGLTLAGSPAPAEDMPAIDGQVTFLYYESLDAPSQFYGETLGFPLTFDLGWVRIYQVSDNASVGIVGEGRGYHKPDTGEAPVMFSIVTPDVDAWYASLTEAGVAIEAPPAPEGEEGAEASGAPIRSFVVRDPGGYTVEFFEWQD